MRLPARVRIVETGPRDGLQNEPKQAFITPHCSAVTLIVDSVAQVAGKIQRLERGEAVTGVVDLKRGY